MDPFSESFDKQLMLRLHVAVNFFKKQLIGDSHVGTRAQVTFVINKLSETIIKPIFSENAWRNWFSDQPVSMKASKARLLDIYAADKFDFCRQRSRKSGGEPSPYFEELIHGGLVSCLLATTKSKQVRQVLFTRAEKYKPISLLHLHLDAVEINTLSENFHDISWKELTEIAGKRILNLLSDLWSPRHGSIYDSFSSPLKIQWEAADADERKRIRESYARFKPDLFEEKLKEGAQPNWSKIGIHSDVAPQHIYKTLFSMAADAEFLVKDRFDSWVFSLATSALAMRAIAWSNRYKTFGVEVTDELLFWSAFDHLLFDSTVKNVDDWYLRPAMNRCAAEWSEESLINFSDTHRIYHEELDDYGISAQEIMEIVNSTRRVHPLVYSG